MSRKVKATQEERVVWAAEAALADQGYARPIDMLSGIGWLYPGADREWRLGRIDYLDDVIQTSPLRVLDALMLLRSWATRKGLVASETNYVAGTPQRQTLRFSKVGDATLEKLY